MAIFGKTKKLAAKIIDVRVDRWMSLDYLKETTGHFKYILSDITTVKKPSYSESFEQACERLQLTVEDLRARQQEFTRLFYFFIILALTIIAFGLFKAIQGQLVACLIAFCLAAYAFSQAFRFHFWLFQLKHKKLGCTAREWFNAKANSALKPEDIE